MQDKLQAALAAVKVIERSLSEAATLHQSDAALRSDESERFKAHSRKLKQARRALQESDREALIRLDAKDRSIAKLRRELASAAGERTELEEEVDRLRAELRRSSGTGTDGGHPAQGESQRQTSGAGGEDRVPQWLFQQLVHLLPASDKYREETRTQRGFAEAICKVCAASALDDTDDDMETSDCD